MPLLVLWGKHGVIEALFDCLADWREVASDVRGRALDAATSSPRKSPASWRRNCAASGKAFDFRPLRRVLAAAGKNMSTESVTVTC